ncbi:MAG: hypothetical protein KDI68_11630 [Gammaproteobacteria bacterium]|nr:hypothetical protein [Gammaproteobacteria bacterium]
MQDEIVFLPDHRGVSVKHVALITGGFFIIVQLFVLDSLGIRLAFTLAFSVFLLVGFWLSARNTRSWPQKIVINHLGICFDNMKAQYGVDMVPWSDVARMDLFHSAPRLPPHLRIGLRQGAFHERVKRSRLQRLGMGLDINIPVSVEAAPEVVLQTAQRYWKEAGQIGS